MSIHTIQVDLKWFNFSQNNSGGYFIQNDVVSEEVFIQARSWQEAKSRAEDLFEPYSDYCECCGERWSFWGREKDGTDEPEINGKRLSEVTLSMFRESARLHYFDGRVEAVTFKGKTP